MVQYLISEVIWILFPSRVLKRVRFIAKSNKGVGAVAVGGAIGVLQVSLGILSNLVHAAGHDLATENVGVSLV